MKKIYIIATFAFCSLSFMAQNKKDSTTRVIRLDEVVVSSLKETNPQQTPVSSTLLRSKYLADAQVTSIKDLSVLVPNFFIPDYGSAMSSAVYIRGIGSRNSGQSMALYVDNVPYLEKSTFDFDFYDIHQIEVLRGSQGTLYGRNAQGGVVNIYTLSPFSYQGTKLAVTTGNYGLLNVKASHYRKLNDNFGVSVSGYYNQNNGFFTNQFTGKPADAETSAGGRAKLDWNINPNFKAQYAVNFDYIDQGAFPYGLYDATTGITAQPNYNDEGSYTRSMLTNSLFLQYKTKDIVLSSTTSHKYFSDDMKMDQDFTPLSYFTLQQTQKQNALNEEINLKSNSNSNYQWSFGITGFWQQLDMTAPVAFKSDALQYILQPVFNQIAMNPYAPKMTITDNVMDIPGAFNTNTRGGAIFHQSTLNNLLVDGLSLTAGLRVDYEKVTLDYNTNTSLNVNMESQYYTGPYTLTDTLKGVESVEFSELLPKVALKYEWGKKQFVYATLSRGYKTGGFNVQMFSDLVQNGLMNSGNPSAPAPDVRKVILYKPEYSWNYEVGGQCLAFNDHLKSTVSLFYINVNDLQLTQFVPSGNGRMISNAGKVVSKGLELSLEGKIGNGFSAGFNYGYANATFATYTDSVRVGAGFQQVDYKGKYVPYAPQHTVSVSGNYEHSFEHAFIDHLMANIQYSGVGKIYWTEANDISQDFYSLINAKVVVTKGAFGLELWAKNLMNTGYNAFYFKSLSKNYFQMGKPMQIGVTLKMEL